MEENVPIAPITTFCIGGPARYFVRVTTVDELREALAFAKEKDLKPFVLGGGSNVLIDDAGFNGLVIKIELMGVEQEGEALIAGAGESWDVLVARAIEAGLWGIENLSGIPGTVGAAPVQNIGAYGTEIKDTLLWLEALDMQTGEVVRFANAECGFGYRTSVFKREPRRYVIMRVALQLKKDGHAQASYKDLGGMDSATIAQIRAKVLDIRAGKFPDLSVEGTAGSFFLNPVVSVEQAGQLASKYAGMPQFAVAGGVKLSLAWLLDNALGLKGTAVGGARLYEKQPLVIAAARNTPARDVRALADLVAQKIKDECKIDVEQEVRVIV